MNTYMAGGRMNAATDATADSTAFVIRNASTTKTIYVREIWAAVTAATVAQLGLVRTSTAGTTPGTTVTPDIDNDTQRAVAPVSGALLETSNFATEPTVAGPYLARANTPAAVGSGFLWVFNTPIAVPQATGLAVVATTAVLVPIFDFTFIWDE